MSLAGPLPIPGAESASGISLRVRRQR
jgi:hypothetical protein